jgi:Glycosyl transferase family 2
MSTDGPLVSIVVGNYNYARFLPRSIGSALGQTYDRVEVVVVDDASTDDSADVIRGFGSRVVPVFKAGNAGHGATFNSGFTASRGDIVMFLDADDYLYPDAARKVVEAWTRTTAQAQFRLDLVDVSGQVVDSYPAAEVAFDSGDVVPLLLTRGRYQATVTSGNAFSRAALQAILPMPEDAFRQGGDGYLVTVAPFHGEIVSIEERLGAYVQHGGNHSGFQSRLVNRLHWQMEHEAARHSALEAKARAMGLRMSPNPGLRDPSHLENRIALRCLDPADTTRPALPRPSLAAHGVVAVLRTRLPLGRRVVLAAWFVAVGLLPRAAARHLVNWRLAKYSRPPAVDRLLGKLRRATS